MASDQELADQIQQKYSSALSEMNLVQVRLQDGKLYVKGAADSHAAAERITNKLAKINPDWSREIELALDAPNHLPPTPPQTVVNTSAGLSQGRVRDESDR
jgi:hypothetical protein